MKIIGLAATLAAAALWGVVSLRDAPPPFAPFQTVKVAGGDVIWQPLGNFSQDGKARTPRPVTVVVPDFEIMKYQVARAEYAVCVTEGACAPTLAAEGAFPQTEVNWLDATAFAEWYSRRTREDWRLPTEQEWQRAAAERYGEPAVNSDARDPGERMLADYANGVLLRGSANPTLRPQGGFGENSLGVADVSGNVWEWTEGCMENGTLDADGSVTLTAPNCGVRIAGGLHRAAVIDFVRDARSGGCGGGLPPDHLGFRLVRGGRSRT